MLCPYTLMVHGVHPCASVCIVEVTFRATSPAVESTNRRQFAFALMHGGPLLGNDRRPSSEQQSGQREGRLGRLSSEPPQAFAQLGDGLGELLVSVPEFFEARL